MLYPLLTASMLLPSGFGAFNRERRIGNFLHPLTVGACQQKFDRFGFRAGNTMDNLLQDLGIPKRELDPMSSLALQDWLSFCLSSIAPGWHTAPAETAGAVCHPNPYSFFLDSGTMSRYLMTHPVGMSHEVS